MKRRRVSAVAALGLLIVGVAIICKLYLSLTREYRSGAELQTLGAAVRFKESALSKLTGRREFLFVDAVSLRDVATEVIVSPSRPLTSLRHLTSLDLNGCRRANEAVAQLRCSGSLAEAHLWGSDISDEGLTALADCKSLQMLVLRDTQIGDEGMRRLAGLPELEFLDLSRTDVTDDCLKTIGTLPKMQDLFLDQTRVTGAGGAECLNRLSHFRWLSLSGCNVSNGLIAELRSPTLTSINVDDTPLTDAVVPLLCRLPNLQSIGVCGTEITADGVAVLRGCFPNAIIEFGYGEFSVPK